MGMSHGRSFSHQRLMPLPGCSMHKPSSTQTSQFFIKEGILSPLVNKSDDSHRGKRMLPLLSKQDMFKLEYNFEEVRKVPFRKTYNREKLVLLNTNSSILTQKESLTRLGGFDRHQSVIPIPFIKTAKTNPKPIWSIDIHAAREKYLRQRSNLQTSDRLERRSR